MAATEKGEGYRVEFEKILAQMPTKNGNKGLDSRRDFCGKYHSGSTEKCWVFYKTQKGIFN